MTMPKMKPSRFDPTPEFYALMDALDAWVKSVGPTWSEGDRALAAMFRGIHYGDASCDCQAMDDLLYNWPHVVERREGSENWLATFRCRACGRIYSCRFADLEFL